MSVGSFNSFGNDGRLHGCYCYLVFCSADSGAYIKIGMSSSPFKRLQAIAASIPIEPSMFAYIKLSGRELAAKAEEALLFDCSEWAARGEWLFVPYEDSAKFRERIKTVAYQFSTPSLKLNWTMIDAKEYRKQQASKSWLYAGQAMKRKAKYGAQGVH